MEATNPVRSKDYILVGAFTLVLYAVMVSVGGPLTMHEGVLSQTTKAMLADGDWLVPHYGEAPWIERPPLPQWISCGLCMLVGGCDHEWQARLGASLAGLLTVLLTVWLSGRLFGRGVAIVSGLILATMYNFARYSTLAEADIFLAPIVAGVISVFAYLEILRPAAEGESRNFFGTRPWAMLAFFTLLGMTNLAKGMVFGTVIAMAPVGTYLLWSLQWSRIARYCWLWGWLAFFAVALPWPLLVLQRLPDAIDVWRFDLLGRLHQNYLAQPAWYYFFCLLWVPQPWTLAAFVGLGITFRKLWQPNSAAHRLIWCWAWMPLLVFSISQGKHHHYMLHYLAPWAILAAQAMIWLWAHSAERMRSRWVIPASIAGGGVIVVALFGRKLPGADWIMPALLVAVPSIVLSAWYFATHRRPDVAVTGGFSVLALLFGVAFAYKGAYLHRSIDDTAFLAEARAAVPSNRPLMLNSADEALEGLRMLFYMQDEVHFLHNLTFVHDSRISDPEVFVVTRFNRKGHLEKYGTVQPLLKCKQSRREQSEDDRWTLFRVRLHDDFERRNATMRITPMQAMYRVNGPNLD